ncbi:transcription termination factor 4, mitochondrial [Echinops telfairi]|uniref:Transcription termination factor 4, mitochondrial n=1 Tax=Echinops telfairi TaxID=9371 RepID=A0ABM0IK87_ECHTE|nr:transcription termination factor 4, mitochondrial [Echinops telfairi]
MGRQTARLGEPRRVTSVSLWRPLTTASDCRSLEKLTCVPSRTFSQGAGCLPVGMPRLAEAPGTPVDAVALELQAVTRSLLDMGFSHAHIGELLSIQPGPRPQQLQNITSELILLGVAPEAVCSALKTHPQLLKLPARQVKQRASYLRKLGLGEGRLRRVLHCSPEVFTLAQRGLDGIIRVLREKCLFTTQQVTEILYRCPHVLRGDPEELEYKFQYAYFRMGVKHSDMVRTELLQFSITKMKQRHVYLERLGRYQRPDKKGQTQIHNPRLRDIFQASEAEFLARTACSSAQEFEVFKQLLAREEEERESECKTADDDEDVGISDGDSDDEGSGPECHV